MKLIKLLKAKNHFIKAHMQTPGGKMLPTISAKDYKTALGIMVYSGLIDKLGKVMLHVTDTRSVYTDSKTIDDIIDYIHANTEMRFEPLPDDAYHHNLTVVETYGINNPSSLGPILAQNKAEKKKLSVVDRKKIEQEKRKNRYEVALMQLDYAKSKFVDSESMISIDVEMFERNHSKILEIGYATLIDGQVEYEHFIIEENLHLKNGKFVPNHRSNFMFGKSKTVSLPEAILNVTQALWRCKNIVGHSVSDDISLLMTNGMIMPPRTMSLLDTADIGRCMLNTIKRTPSLKDLMEKFDIGQAFLHNAGNDSAYTLHVLMKMVTTKPVKLANVA